MPTEIEASIPRIRAICEGYRFPMIALDGYEADDVIGTLALKARDSGMEAVIVSGDKDFYQLVQPGVHLLNPGRGGATGVAPARAAVHSAKQKALTGVSAGQGPETWCPRTDVPDCTWRLMPWR